MNLIDSNVLIDVRRGRPEAHAWLVAEHETAIAVPGIVLMEVVSGCRDRVDLDRTREWLESFPVVWPEADDVQLGYQLLTQFRLSHGTDIGDAIVAAMAIRREARVVTLNLRHFLAIPGLDAVAPYTRT